MVKPTVAAQPGARLLFVLAGAVMVGGAACGPAPACGLELCDIRVAACQSRIAAATACLRGVAPLAVPIRIKDRARFLAEAEAAASGADAQYLSRVNAGLGLIGLASPDVTPAQTGVARAGLVAAFYSLDDKSITIIDWGEPLDSSGAVALLVHEVMHALQDRAFGIDRFRASVGNDFDRFLAARSMTEGEATLLQDLTHLSLFGSRPAGIDWAPVFGQWQARARQRSLESETPVDLASLLFPYPFGTPLLVEAHRRDGFAGVDALYARPPASSAQVLFAGQAPAPPEGPPVEELTLVEPVLPERFERLWVERMGSWVLWAMLDRLQARSAAAPRRGQTPASGSLPSSSALFAEPSAARQLAEGLTADRLSIFHDTVLGGPLVCWRLRFVSAALAARLGGALVLDRPNRIWVDDREVTICAAAADATLAFVGPEQPFGSGPVTAADASADSAGMPGSALPFGASPTTMGGFSWWPEQCALHHIPANTF